MAINITGIRLSGGTDHQHIVRLWWTDPATGKTGENTRAEIVAWIENDPMRYPPAHPPQHHERVPLRVVDVRLAATSCEMRTGR